MSRTPALAYLGHVSCNNDLPLCCFVENEVLFLEWEVGVERKHIRRPCSYLRLYDIYTLTNFVDSRKKYQDTSFIVIRDNVYYELANQLDHK